MSDNKGKSSGIDSSIKKRRNSELQSEESPQARNASQDSQEATTNTTNPNNRNLIVSPQITIFQQVQSMTANPQTMQMQQQGLIPPQKFMMPQTVMMAPTIPAYVISTALPPEIYFQQGWYTPIPLPAPSSQASMATTMQVRTEGRRTPCCTIT